MAILRHVDGRLCDLPDDLLSQFEVSAELVGQVVAALGHGGADGRVEIRGAGTVEPYGRH